MFHPALPLTPFIPTLSNVYHQPTNHQPTNHQRHQPPPLADDSALRQHRIPVRRSHQPPVLVGSHLGGCTGKPATIQYGRNTYKKPQGESTMTFSTLKLMMFKRDIYSKAWSKVSIFGIRFPLPWRFEVDFDGTGGFSTQGPWYVRRWLKIGVGFNNEPLSESRSTR